jgi:zinc-ribbon domain
MQKCSYCGAELPENSRFCGKCGSVQDTTATDAATSRSNTPQPYWTPEGGTLPASQPPYPYPVQQDTFPTPGSQPSWSPNTGSPATPPPPPPSTENEDERGGVPPWSPLYGAGLGADALMSGGQPYGYGAPVVQGTPQIGGVPSVAGSPTPYTNPPAGHLAQGPAYQSPSTYYPQAGQQPTYYPPQHQGTPDQHPQTAPHGHHAQHAQHLHHTAAGATKVAGTSGLKTVIIIVATVVVVAGGGIATAAYFLTRPQPLISITSNYNAGSTPAGANGTVLDINGQKFSGNSAITFLLDGNPAPGNPSAHSDSNGNFSAKVQITGAWSIGMHTLTARDASNYSTKNSVSVTIVPPGVAHTPGPNGAPPDDATFTISLSATGSYTGNQPFTRNETLHITGRPDPAGGTVCQDGDNGQQFTTQSTTLDTHLAFSETYSLTCQGSYKSGKVSYTETLTTDVITYTSSGVSCSLTTPRVNQQVTGTYTSQNTFSGTLTYGATPQSDFHCTQPNWYFYYVGGQGTWTGTVGGL